MGCGWGCRWGCGCVIVRVRLCVVGCESGIVGGSHSIGGRVHMQFSLPPYSCEYHVHVLCYHIVNNPLVALMYVHSVCVQCLCDVYKSLTQSAGAVPGGSDVVQLLPQPVHRRGH